MEWGFLPVSAKDRTVSKKYATFNARAETAATSHLYAPALKHNQKCLIPTDSFFEWGSFEGKKEKVEIKKNKDAPFAIAGLWNFSPHVEEAPLWTFTMLTTRAGKDISPFHARMPVVLEKEDWNPWLFGELDLREITETARGLSFKEDILHSP
jgi:putative SOS response-associated peptidase YedK